MSPSQNSLGSESIREPRTVAPNAAGTATESPCRVQIEARTEHGISARKRRNKAQVRRSLSPELKGPSLVVWLHHLEVQQGLHTARTVCFYVFIGKQAVCLFAPSS